MPWLYLVFNIVVILGPLALSFDRKVAFYRRWPRVGISLLAVSTIYLVWDVFATRAGHWYFNPEYAGTVRIAHLPIGEILFFVTVPYACLFVYEVVRAYFPERRAGRVGVVRVTGIAIAFLLGIAAILLRGQGYTAVVLASVAVMLVATVVFDPQMWLGTHTLFFFIFSIALFMAANTVLTALPIVGYGAHAIWGARVITIPVEDFLYNFSMLGLYLFVYRLAARLGRRAAHREHEARP